MDKLEITYKKLKDLTPYDKNARRHADADVDTIVHSIQDFGMNDPIGIWGEKNIIVEGHGRYEACKKLGITEVPTIRLDHLDDEQRRAYALAHNKTAEMSEWDYDILNLEVENIFDFDMEDYGFELPGDIGPEIDEGNARERTYKATNLDEFDKQRCCGKFDMPIITAVNHVPKDLISFNYMLTSKEYDKGIHFFIDDYQFERLWNSPQDYLYKFQMYDCVLTPDFSLYTDMPIAMQVWNTYRSRMIGQMMQDAGAVVIPTVSWSREQSYEFCFDGIEQNGTIAVSTVGVKNTPGATSIWVKGMDECMNRLHPGHVIVYGGDIGYEYSCGTTYIANHNTERFANLK